MWFDLTKEAALDAKNYKIYKALQIALYASAFLLAVYFAFKVIFPSAYFSYTYGAMGSANSINVPRDAAQAPLLDGRMAAGQNSYFDATANGNFSKIAINLSLNAKSTMPAAAEIQVRKSYQAFLYPEGDPIGFKNGTLLKNKTNYYLVSEGALRKFASPNIIPSLGYSQDAFMEVSQNDLKYNPAGNPITDNNNYPDDSLFKVGDDYYILQAGILKKFVSTAAFLDQYKSVQAIAKNENFLTRYPISEDMAGFNEDSLVSYANSIYIINQGEILPIDSPTTFVSKGFDWNNVEKASADEIALYKKGKLFNIASPHPDGTIFKTDTGKYYMIMGQKKHLLPSDNIANSWMNHSIVPVSAKSLDITDSCAIKKDLLSLRTYSCEISISDLQSLDGSDYEFAVSPKNDIRLNSLNVTFSTAVNMTNLKSSIKSILSGVKNNYVPTATQ